MFYPSHKYFGEQDERHGGQLHWPGVNGIPFRGDAVPNLRQEELETLPCVGDFHYRSFDLTDPKDAEDYHWYKDRIGNRAFREDFTMRYVDPVTGHLIVYMEWTQMYIQGPPKSMPRSQENGRSAHQFSIRST